MKIKLPVMLCFAFLIATHALAQYYKKNTYYKTDKPVPNIISFQGGFASGETNGGSFYGPYASAAIRFPVIRMGSYFNFSVDGHADVQLASGTDNQGKKFSYLLPDIQACFNLNGFAGAWPESVRFNALATPVGGFLGPGIFVIPVKNSLSGIDMGPMFNAGIRIKPGHAWFFELRVFGAYTLSDKITIGGVGLAFPMISE